MAIVTKTRTYGVNDTITAANYNDDRDEVIAGVNSIDNAQISPTAGINESKLAFASGGHGHTGGSDGKPIVLLSLSPAGLTPLKFIRVNSGGTAIESADLTVFNRAFTWFLNKTLIVEDDPSINPVVPQGMTAVHLYAYVKLAPTGSGITAVVKTVAGATIGSVTIPAGANEADTTLNVGLSVGSHLRMDVTAVGSGTAGQGLTVMLDCTQP